MAIDDAYFSVPQYKAYAKKESSADDLQIADDALMATRWLEERCHQFFGKDDAVVNRVFRAKYSDLLDLDYEGNNPGIATTSGLVIKVDTDNDGSFADETAWATTDYDLEPLQAAQGPLVRPYNTIRVKRSSSNYFTPGYLVQVTAIWGWPAVPLIAKEVAMEWCAVWRGESIRTTARVNEMDQIETVSPYHIGQMNKLMAVCEARVSL